MTFTDSPRNVRMSKVRSGVTGVVSTIPIVLSVALVEFVEPFPSKWLDPANPFFAENIVRACTFLFGGVVLGLISYVMLKSSAAENRVSGGHPRKKLYQHISVVALSHGLLMASFLFFVRERVDHPLSPATPFALVGMIGSFAGLRLMISYQNSRLRSFHSAKQVLGTIEPSAPGDAHDLCLRAIGSVEPMRLHDWIDEFRGGVLVRMTVEKIEEA